MSSAKTKTNNESEAHSESDTQPSISININDKFVNEQDSVHELSSKQNFIELYSYVEEKMITHGKSKIHYYKRNLFFIIPSILITGLSGIISFLSSSSIVLDNDVKTVLTIFVGILASISAILQSVSGACNFNGKSEAHSIATEDYEQIHTLLILELNRNKILKFNESFYKNILKSILEINKKCNYLVPSSIQESYKKNKNIHEIENLYNRYIKKLIKMKEDKLDNDIDNKKFNITLLKNEIDLLIKDVKKKR